MRSGAPNRKEKIPGERGEDVEAHQGLEGVGAAPEEEIGGEGRRWRRCSVAAAVRCGRRGREGRGVERRPEGILYRWRGEGRGHGQGGGGVGGAGAINGTRCGRRVGEWKGRGSGVGRRRCLDGEWGGGRARGGRGGGAGVRAAGGGAGEEGEGAGCRLKTGLTGGPRPSVRGREREGGRERRR
jgi:hypothetical protein